MIEHTAAGFADLLRRLGRLTGDPADVPVGIERPDGRLVDALLEAGFPVVPVSPNAIKTWRDGEVLSGAKSDAGDATVIAEYLRLRAHHLRVATPYSGQTRALRTVVRTPGRRGRHARRRDEPAIARGHDHPHAVRVLARAWIRIIYRCWNTNMPYDATKHGNATALLQPQFAA